MKATSRVLALLTALLIVLTGCSSQEGSGPSGEQTREQSPEGSPDASGSPDSDEGGEAADPPDGMQVLRADQVGLQFAAPEGWTVIDPERFNDPQLEDQLTKSAEAMNLTLEQFKQSFAQVAIMAMAPPSGPTGFSENVNLTLPPGGQVPDEQQLRSQFRAINAEVGTVEDVETPIGEGRVVEYSLDPGTGTVDGASLVVLFDGQVVNLTVSRAEQGSAGELIDRIAPTLQQTG